MSARAFIFWLLGAGVFLSNRGGFAGLDSTGDLASLVDDSVYDVSATSPWIALAAFVALTWRRRSRIADACAVGAGSGSGFVLFLAGFGLMLWWRQLGVTRLAIPAVVLELAGVASLLGGARLLQTLSLPLLALAFGAPLPPELINQLVFPLQLAAAGLSSSLLDLVGFAHELRGDLIVTDGTVFQVIEGCSGLRSTLSLMLASLVYADFVFVPPRVLAWLLVSAIPIGIGMNAVRVALLVVGRFGPESGEHFALGLLAIVVGMVVVALVELLIARATAARTRREADSRREDLGREPVGASGRRRVPGVGVIVVVLSLSAELVPIASWPSPSPAIQIDSLPESILDRSAREERNEDGFLGSVWFQHRLHRAYASKDGGEPAIRVFIGHEDLVDPDRSGFSPKTVVPASGWLSRRRVFPDSAGDGSGKTTLADPRGSERWIFDYPGRRTLVLHWRVGYAPWGAQVVERALLLDRIGASGARRSPLVIRLECDGNAADDAHAWMILRQFAGVIERWYDGVPRSAGRR